MNKNKTSQLKIQARLLLEDEIAFGPGKADLLDAIAETGSISAAAKKMGMSYRRAWLLVDAMNRCFEKPLVETATGGVQGGGTRLTETAIELLNSYRELQKELQQISNNYLQDFQPHLRKKPLPASN